MHPAELIRIHTESTDILTFYFKPLRPFRYQAGQFIELLLPHENADARGSARWFTLSSSPTEDLLMITTHIPDQASSFKSLLQDLKPGAKVSFSSPLGDFTLPKAKTSPLVFIAGGIGITPIRSMITFCYDMGQKRDITLLVNGKNNHSLIFLDEKPFKFLPMTKITGRHLQSEDIENVIHPNPQCRYYLSGPEGFIKHAKKLLIEQHVSDKYIQTDTFIGL